MIPISAQTPATADDERTLRLIVVNSVDEAERTLARLASGETFASVAREVSIDPTAGAGGWLGPVALSGLRPELRAAITGVAEGGLTRPVAIPTGVAILQVVSPVEGADQNGAPGRALAATGSVKYVTDLSGMGAATVVLQDFPKSPDWNMNPRTICELRTASTTAAEEVLRRDLASATANAELATPYDRIQLHIVLAQLYAYRGNMAGAIDVLERGKQVALALHPPALSQVDELLGIAHLHKAQVDNDLFHGSGDAFLITDKAPAPLVNRRDAAKAIEYFTAYLSVVPEDLEGRWLLNLAHMANGTYADGMPAAQRIPLSAFASAESVGRFVDVAAKMGLSSFASAGGIIVDDFDNDGGLDVVTSSLDTCQPMHFFRLSGGRYVEQAARAGLSDQLGGLNLMQADYDNDGFLDILLLRGGWELPQRRSLLHNNGDGTFTDVTLQSGLSAPTATQTAVWVDVNRDGFLDLFVGNESSPAQLFVNRGNGTFEDVAARAGVGRTAYAKGVAAGDYDNDGWPDLYVSNLGGVNFLYHNERDGTFSEVARVAGVPGPSSGFATWFFDYDNDGWQDLFVTSYFTSLDEVARTYLNLPHNANTLKLYRNLGNGRFEDVSRAVGLDKVFMPMGANYGDIDNDGYLDIYLATGNPSYASVVPNVLLRNRQGTTFVDVTASSGTGEMHKGHGVAFADLDGDGDQEILTETGGATPGDAHMLRVFDNPGHGNDWIGLKLTGVKTNRSAVGARVTITVGSSGNRRVIHRTIGSGGSFGASPLQQHVGLGANAGTVDIDVCGRAAAARSTLPASSPTG